MKWNEVVLTVVAQYQSFFMRRWNEETGCCYSEVVRTAGTQPIWYKYAVRPPAAHTIELFLLRFVTVSAAWAFAKFQPLQETIICVGLLIRTRCFCFGQNGACWFHMPEIPSSIPSDGGFFLPPFSKHSESHIYSWSRSDAFTVFRRDMINAFVTQAVFFLQIGIVLRPFKIKNCWLKYLSPIPHCFSPSITFYNFRKGNFTVRKSRSMKVLQGLNGKSRNCICCCESHCGYSSAIKVLAVKSCWNFTLQHLLLTPCAAGVACAFVYTKAFVWWYLLVCDYFLAALALLWIFYFVL